MKPLEGYFLNIYEDDFTAIVYDNQIEDYMLLKLKKEDFDKKFIEMIESGILFKLKVCEDGLLFDIVEPNRYSREELTIMKLRAEIFQKILYESN